MTDEREWRKFMDQKWQSSRDRDSFNKGTPDDGRIQIYYLLYGINQKLKKLAKKKKQPTGHQTVPDK